MGKRVIVATASADWRKSLKTLLEQGGYAVLPARDTSEALALLKEHEPELVLVDARLPGVTEKAALQLLQPTQQGSRPRVALLTSANELPQEALPGGANNLVDMLQAKSLEAELLREMGKFTARGGDLAAACGRLLELALRLTGASGALLALKDESGLVTHLASPTPLTSSFWRRMLGRVAEHSEELRWGKQELKELEEGLAFKLEELPDDLRAHNLAIRHFQLLPLMGRGNQRGLLALGYSKKPNLPAAVEEAMKLAFPYAGVVLENLLLHKKLWMMSREDSLTGLANRREFEERLAEELKRFHRYGTGFAVLMLDLDNLKFVNDELGHAVGDEVLQRMGQALKTSLRSVDLPARYGGDEFVVILPETTSHLRRIGERVRRAVERNIFKVQGVRALGNTGVSVGIASCPEHGTSRDKLLEAVDEALYQAKHLQGSKVRLAEAPPGVET